MHLFACDRLLLLDLQLQIPQVGGNQAQLIETILNAPNGYEVAAALDRSESVDLLPPKDFRFKPLIALVTAHAEQVEHQMPLSPDGSVLGCDILLGKPLNVRSVGALLEGSFV
eukprot:7214-Prymnesium_polylepis.3